MSFDIAQRAQTVLVLYCKLWYLSYVPNFQSPWKMPVKGICPRHKRNMLGLYERTVITFTCKLAHLCLWQAAKASLKAFNSSTLPCFNCMALMFIFSTNGLKCRHKKRVIYRGFDRSAYTRMRLKPLTNTLSWFNQWL